MLNSRLSITYIKIIHDWLLDMRGACCCSSSSSSSSSSILYCSEPQIPYCGNVEFWMFIPRICLHLVVWQTIWSKVTSTWGWGQSKRKTINIGANTSDARVDLGKTQQDKVSGNQLVSGRTPLVSVLYNYNNDLSWYYIIRWYSTQKII